jgi:hypothetical protein
VLSFFRYAPYMWKAIAAYLGTLGVSLPITDLMNAVDVNAFLHVLMSKGWQAALLSLIPAILTYMAKNKEGPVVHSNVAHMGVK